MSRDKALQAAGASSDSWSHAVPTAGLDKLQPALLTTNKIELTKTRISSGELIARMQSDGASIKTFGAPIYRSGTYTGANRQFSGADLVKGKSPLYDDPAHAIDIARRLHSFTADLIDRSKAASTPSDRIVGSMEMQDAEKLTIQQWKPTGWHLAKPYADWFKKKGPDKDVLPYLELVVKRYISVISDMLGKSDEFYWKLAENDWHPAESMTGLWTNVGGERTFEARSLMLASLRNPLTTPPDQWIAHYNSLGASLGLDPGMIYSAVVATRSGPLKKEVTLWSKDPVGYTASWAAKGAYNRVRFVFPSAYPVNFILAPVYILLSTARQRIPGLWHDPASQADYIARMKKQGGSSWTIDFSGMDTGMSPALIQAINELLLRNGFPQWILQTWTRLYDTMGIFLPSYSGNPGEVEWLHGAVRPWGSGFQLTSEYDTIYGAACLLSSLDDQVPGLSKKWFAGEWTFAELGDDIIFTLAHDLDPKRLSDFAMEHWGAKLEILDDAMFLKAFLPVDSRITVSAKPFARFVQQTFWNEDSYDGIEGGSRPDCVMRLALLARGELLPKHPWFSQLWPALSPMVGDLAFARSATKAWRDDLAKGVFRLDEGDDAAIQLYAQRTPQYLKNLIARAQYEPSAGVLLRRLQELGALGDDMITERQQRVFLLKQLLADSDRSAFAKSLAFTPFR